MIFNDNELNLLRKDFNISSISRENGTKYELVIFKGPFLGSYCKETNENQLCLCFPSKLELLLFVYSILEEKSILSLAYDILPTQLLKEWRLREVRNNKARNFVKELRNSSKRYTYYISDGEYNRGISKGGFCKSNLPKIKKAILDYDLL